MGVLRMAVVAVVAAKAGEVVVIVEEVVAIRVERERGRERLLCL